MLACYFICLSLVIPLIFGNNTSTANNITIANKSVSTPVESHSNDSNQRKLGVPSESGSILPKLLLLSLPKDTNKTKLQMPSEGKLVESKLPLLSLPKDSNKTIIEIPSEGGSISPKVLLPTLLNSSEKSKTDIISEGGSNLPKPTLLSLPKENHTNLIALDKEIGKTKEKSSVARKGVIYNPLEENLSTTNFRKDRIDTTVTKSGTNKLITQTVNQLNSSAPNLTHGSLHNVSVANITKPVEHKKPLVVSYEALSEIGKKAENVKSTKLETSSKSIVPDQLPSPNIKIQNSNRHPGMIMPVVITMLVVPMFAVLGYMALRRGQEAWKNRHYKRMDFLLDGMYND